MGENENKEKVILGRQLRAIMLEAKESIEIQNFTNKLINAAKQGLDKLEFDDLRDEVPTMIMNGTLNQWLADNELSVTGAVDQNSGAYVYTVMW